MVSFLYIEDDPVNQRIFAQIVRDYLHYPPPVIWGDTADLEARLKNLGEARFDVILVDIGIGPLDGIEVLPYLRQHPPFANSKIVAFTATLDDRQLQRMRQVGFDGSLAKPLDIMNFEATVQAILSGQSVWQV